MKHRNQHTGSDFIGRTFGHLEVIEKLTEHKGDIWLCKCHLCGISKIFKRCTLYDSISCGCSKRKPIGHKFTLKQGYVRIKVANNRGRNISNTNYQFEHKVVMEAILGRKLYKKETVHHKNGVKNDNRPENLELWYGGQPTGQRVDDLVKWAWEIIHKYDPNFLALIKEIK